MAHFNLTVPYLIHYEFHCIPYKGFPANIPAQATDLSRASHDRLPIVYVHYLENNLLYCGVVSCHVCNPLFSIENNILSLRLRNLSLFGYSIRDSIHLLKCKCTTSKNILHVFFKESGPALKVP